MVQGAVHSLLHEVESHRQFTLVTITDWVETRLKKWSEEGQTSTTESPADPSAAAAQLDAVISASASVKDDEEEETNTEQTEDVGGDETKNLVDI